MRTFSATLTALALAALGALVPATGAQAATPCDNAWNSAPPGYLYLYGSTNCNGLLARAGADDPDWYDTSGPVRGLDTGDVGSLLQKGTTGMAVKLYEGPGHTGDHVCLTRSEPYVSETSELTFPDGRPVNSIRSHQWVSASECAA
ncbi:hypothetical protein AB0L99_22625 [Streptomyces sp. NPDC051954]|uniref:hypothetical protein n=1 Tax=Streptomyces sp. NPDC051954 TaxID=3155524 RepID=UPI00342734A3